MTSASDSRFKRGMSDMDQISHAVASRPATCTNSMRSRRWREGFEASYLKRREGKVPPSIGHHWKRSGSKVSLCLSRLLDIAGNLLTGSEPYARLRLHVGD